MNRLYQFIRLEKPSCQERIDPIDLLRVVVVEPRRSLERIRVQSGYLGLDEDRGVELMGNEISQELGRSQGRARPVSSCERQYEHAPDALR